MSSARINKRAISAVLTTIIILVASIVLATAVVVYSTSLFQTGGQEQAIQVQGARGWINSTAQSGIYYAWGAAAVRNSGDKILSVDSIQMRGAFIPYSSWFANSTQSVVTSGSNFQAQFNLTKLDQNGNPIGSAANGGVVSPASTCAQSTRGILPFTTIVIDEDGSGVSTPLCLKQANGPTALNPGDKMIVYFKIPNGVIGAIDSGSAVTVNVYAGNVGGPTTVQVGNP